MILIRAWSEEDSWITKSKEKFSLLYCQQVWLIVEVHCNKNGIICDFKDRITIPNPNEGASSDEGDVRINFSDSIQIYTLDLLLTFSRLMTYICHTSPLTTRCFILYIYSTNIRTEYLNMLHTLRFFLFKMPFIS